jgi:peptide-methionine (S)-S-oxide reductase
VLPRSFGSSPRPARASGAAPVATALWLGAIAAAIVAAGAVVTLLPPRRGPDRAADRVGNPALGTRPGGVGRGTALAASEGNALAIFAQGCFWGVEERFRRVPGVVATAAGYTGGEAERPTYGEVSGGATGHVEAVLLEFDPRRVSYRELLRVFWETHDPTSGDRQGPDSGRQYRSAIHALDEAQLREALASREEEQRALADPITTEVVRAGRFWLAEDEHQQRDERVGYRSCPAPERARRR